MEEDVVERLTLRSAMEELPEREQQVLLLRYYKNLTQIQCARVLGVSQVQISRLERRGGGPAAEDPVRGRSVLRLLCPRRGRKIMGCRLRKKSLEDFFAAGINTPGPYQRWYGPGVFTE